MLGIVTGPIFSASQPSSVHSDWIASLLSVAFMHSATPLIQTFREICQRGRDLRMADGGLSGDAVDEVKTGVHFEVMPLVLADCLGVMHNVDRMHTTTLMNHLTNLSDHYGDFTPDQLAEELERAGVQRSTKQVKVDGRNLNGWYASDLKAAAARYGRVST